MTLKLVNFRIDEFLLDAVDQAASLHYPRSEGGNRSAMICDIVSTWVAKQRMPNKKLVQTVGGQWIMVTYRGNAEIEAVEVVGDGS